jgi:hypothetical protein
MNLVTRFIFDPRNQLFVPLEEGHLSVQPNPHPPPHIKLKHYRLAGTASVYSTLLKFDYTRPTYCAICM